MRSAVERHRMPEDNNSVVIEDLVKRFGDFVAVDRINLDIR